MQTAYHVGPARALVITGWPPRVIRPKVGHMGSAGIRAEASGDSGSTAFAGHPGIRSNQRLAEIARQQGRVPRHPPAAWLSIQMRPMSPMQQLPRSGMSTLLMRVDATSTRHRPPSAATPPACCASFLLPCATGDMRFEQRFRAKSARCSTPSISNYRTNCNKPSAPRPAPAGNYPASRTAQRQRRKHGATMPIAASCWQNGNWPAATCQNAGRWMFSLRLTRPDTISSMLPASLQLLLQHRR